MADETIVQAGDGADGAAPGTGTEAERSRESTSDAPGFDKESFGEMLNRVTSEKLEDKAEPTDDTPEPEESETKVETKDELPPEAPKEEEGTEDDELELLTAKEIDARHPKAPKPLREYAKRITKQYEPYVQAIDELGGIEAVKRLDKMATVALGVPDMKEGGNLDQFHDYVKSLNPEFLDAYNKKLFYSALDDPKDAEALLNPFIQGDERYKDFTFSKLKELADMVIDGDIDLEEIKEKLDAARPEEAKRRKAAEEKSTAEAAANAEKDARITALEAKEQQEARNKDVVEIWNKYQETAAPVWKQFGLGKDFIKSTDSEEIKTVKQAYLDDLNNAIGRRLSANPLFKDLAQRLGQKERGDGYAWLVDRCAHIYKGVVREEAMKRQGLMSGYLKSYGQPVKETKTRRPEPEVDARTAAHARTTERPEEAHEEERAGGLGRLLEQKAKEQAA